MTKDSYAQDGGYAYASTTKLFALVGPVLNEEGLSLDVDEEEVEYKDVTSAAGRPERLFRVRLHFYLEDLDTGYRKDCGVKNGYGQNRDEKGYGTAQTYAMRYFILNNFLVATPDDDPDAKGGRKDMKPVAQAPVQTVPVQIAPANPAPAQAVTPASVPQHPKAEPVRTDSAPLKQSPMPFDLGETAPKDKPHAAPDPDDPSYGIPESEFAPASRELFRKMVDWLSKYEPDSDSWNGKIDSIIEKNAGFSGKFIDVLQDCARRWRKEYYHL